MRNISLFLLCQETVLRWLILSQVCRGPWPYAKPVTINWNWPHWLNTVTCQATHHDPVCGHFVIVTVRVISHEVFALFCLHSVTGLPRQHEDSQLTVLPEGLALGKLFECFLGNRDRQQDIKIKVYRHLSPVGLGHWFATHQTPAPNQDETSSCPPTRGNSW